jgi:hypothetical protein
MIIVLMFVESVVFSSVMCLLRGDGVCGFRLCFVVQRQRIVQCFSCADSLQFSRRLKFAYSTMPDWKSFVQIEHGGFA